MIRLAAGLTALSLAASGAHASSPQVPIVICAHAAVSGASPITVSPARMGQVYFDAINAEHEGIDGRLVRMTVWDDQSNPTGAIAVVDRCLEDDADLVVGMSGRTETAYAARRAASHGLPYLATVEADWQAVIEGDAMDGCCSSLSPSDERMMEAVWDGATGTSVQPTPRAAIVSVRDPLYDPGVDAFADAAGEALVAKRRVQEAETPYRNVWTAFRSAGADFVNVFLPDRAALRFLEQRPALYEPAIVVTGAQLDDALVDVAPRGTVFVSDAVPAYSSDPDLPWAAAVAEQRRQFETYSDDFSLPSGTRDWRAFVRVGQLARILDSLDGDVSPAAVLGALDTYEEDGTTAFPSCALSLRQGGAGARAFHLVEIHDGTQVDRGHCAERLDLRPPALLCGGEIGRSIYCPAGDRVSGLASIEVSSVVSASPWSISESFACTQHGHVFFKPPAGLHVFRAVATDCVGRTTEVVRAHL